ncbi:MAG: hypothetical protein ACXVPN_01780 [Bacteroidia bacterium]
MKVIKVLPVLIAIVLLSCKKDSKVVPPAQPFTKAKVSGLSQKGPFLNGSALTIYELDASFAQTGKSFNTQILDNLGSFEINNISLVTQYAKLKADGFYFNEVSNANSGSPISLYALSDLSNKNNVNVNLLSTLEVSRAQYLIDHGTSFTNAKRQAQQEILKIFWINKPSISESELLNIAVNTDDNAALLALSVILQGYRTESELTQLLGDIATDIRTDGILNSPTLGSQLINDARYLNLPAIRLNIENKYISLGVTTVIPDFEKYINQFKDSCTYTFTNYITYPATCAYGTNLLNTTDSVLTLGNTYSICANLPKGTTLKIYYPEPSGTPNGIVTLGYYPATVSGWLDMNAPYRTFTSTTSGLIDMEVLASTASSPASLTISIYENGSSTPTRTKNIYIP